MVNGCHRRYDALMTAFKNDNIKALLASAEKKKANKEDKLMRVDKRESDDHCIRAAALETLKRKPTNDVDPEESDSTDVVSIVVDFPTLIVSSNNLMQDDINAKKEETAVAQRRLELDQQRYLLEKAK
ncbi:hypothetical protein ACHHYP_06382 [Achlya hypogyna]|uniref:Uncharacterized protein n=1 Tax=Achlya hypogyna TaxID=1202772 RepID=A0A1V9YTY8_ACHHY|nr:hypothetical protein ACHHYP_06382 [Achlya hypogyna]